MANILITGATGNVGVEVIRHLYKIETPNRIIAGVRNVDNAKKRLIDFPNLDYVYFDFGNPESYDSALYGIDRVFLLRPPQLSDTDKYFKPLILKFAKHNIREIIFLSVQGAEKSKIIPHNKIERLIIENNFDFIFLRPSYFMQNLTTTLINDINLKRKIILPTGNAKFNWIDIENIGEVAAILLDKFSAYRNQSHEITGLKNLNFADVTTLINEVIENPISYRSVNPVRFFWIKKKEGMITGMILIMILLHFLPRFQNVPKISFFYEQLTGKKPTDLKAFLEREKKQFENHV